MTDLPQEPPWFASLNPTQPQLDAARQAILARLNSSSQPASEQLSLSAEWLQLLREQPVANTLLVSAAAATILISLPLGAAVAAAKLFML